MTWLIDTLFYTGVLIAAVLVLRRPAARLFGPGFAYALWLLPLARMVLPPLVLPAAPTPAPQTSTERVITLIDAAPLRAAPGFDFTLWLETLWLGGAMLFLVWRLATYHQTRRRVMEGAAPVGEKGQVRLIESDAVRVPMAFGITDKVVALPTGFMNQEDRKGRDLAIAHELEHHAGRDLAVNFAMQPLLALHWFNPLAWIGWRALRRDQEAACDARVLAGRDPATREAYGRLITRFAAGSAASFTPALACPVVLGEKSIIYRLRSLTMTQPSARRRLTGRLLIAAAALALPFTASISRAASDDPAPVKEEVRKESRIMIVEKHGPDGDDSKLKTKVVTRDGKTIVIKTDKELSDAEVEERIAKALAMVPKTPELLPLPEGSTRTAERRVIVMRKGDEADKMRVVTLDAEAMQGKCSNEDPVDVSNSDDKAGNSQTVRIKVCSDHPDKTEIAKALREARDEVASNKDIPDDVRAKVLKNLEEQIEKLAKQG